VLFLVSAHASNVLLDAALSYAAQGMYVFPTHDIASGSCSCKQSCPSPGKHPRTQRGLNDSTIDPVTIASWWRTWPSANVAIDCGRSGLVVADVDVKKGARGEATMRWFLERSPAFRETLMVSTPTGGFHFYFTGQRKSGQGTLGEGIDVRSTGGYVLAPPSIAFARYDEDNRPVAGAFGKYAFSRGARPLPFPGEIIPEKATAPEPDVFDFVAREHDGPERDEIPYGEHRQSLLWLGWHLRAVQGLSVETGLPIMRDFFKALGGYNPANPFSDRDLRVMLSNVAPNIANVPPPVSAAPLIDSIVPASVILSQDVPVRQHFIPGLILQGELHVFYGDTGIGKGHPYATRLLTPSGWRTVGEVAVGDSVIGANGYPTKILAVYERGVLPTYRVTFTDGSSVLVDGDHLWSVASWKQMRAGQKGCIVATRNLKANSTEYIPMVEPVSYPEVELPLAPYVLGTLLGNAHFKGTPIAAINPADVDIIERLKQESDALEYKQTSARRVAVRNCRDTLRHLGLYGMLSAGKFVPENYMRSSVTQRIALLQGLMDADGSVRCEGGRSQALFHTTSAQLANNVLEIVESLGGIGRLLSYQRAGYVEFRIGLTLPPHIEPFFSERKKSKYKATRLPARKVKSVILAGHFSIRCIRVDAKDSLYVTEAHIVTHNTTIVAHELAHITNLGRDVLVFISEDRPRDFDITFALSGGALERLYNHRSEVRELLLPKCTPELEQLIASRPWGAIYFDSIMDLRSTDVRDNAADTARKLFGPLSVFAQRYNVAIICTTHVNKTGVFEGAQQIKAKSRVFAKVARPPKEQSGGTDSKEFDFANGYDPKVVCNRHNRKVSARQGRRAVHVSLRDEARVQPVHRQSGHRARQRRQAARSSSVRLHRIQRDGTRGNGAQDRSSCKPRLASKS
jgi:hypothetical protein